MNILKFFKLFIIFTSIVIQTQELHAQSDYKVDTFTVVYDTLTVYKSIVKENILAQEWFFLFDKEFELGFDFPFFDKSFDKISFSSYGLGLFVDDFGWYNIYALDNDWDICDEPNTLSNIKYDYRYKHDTENGKKVFKLEWHNVCLYGLNSSKNRSFNFQTWLWQNGDVDLRFGKMLRDTSIFIPGFGFNTHSSYSAGNFGLVNTDDTKAIFYADDYLSPNILEGNPDEILFFGRSTIKTLPHEGFVIRFKKQTSSTSDVNSHKPFPNVVRDILSIPSDFKYSEYRIYDFSGKELLKGSDSEIHLSHLSSGYYVIKLSDGAGIYSYKFLRQ